MSSSAKQVEAYRQFAASVAEHLIQVYAVDGSARGTGAAARAVLRAIREDLRILRLAVEFPHPDEAETGLQEEQGLG